MSLEELCVFYNELRQKKLRELYSSLIDMVVQTPKLWTIININVTYTTQPVIVQNILAKLGITRSKAEFMYNLYINSSQTNANMIIFQSQNYNFDNKEDARLYWFIALILWNRFIKKTIPKEYEGFSDSFATAYINILRSNSYEAVVASPCSIIQTGCEYGYEHFSFKEGIYFELHVGDDLSLKILLNRQ